MNGPRQPWGTSSLRFRLAVGASAITLGAMLVFAVIARSLLREGLLERLDEDLGTQAAVLLQEVTAHPDGRFDANVQTVLQAHGEDSSARVYRAERLVWESPVKFAPVRLEADGGPRSVVSRDGWRVLSVRDGTHTVLVQRSQATLEATLGRYDRSAVLGGLGAAALVGLLLGSMMVAAARPLGRLVDRVEDLEGSDPIPGLGRNDEIGRLARALEASLHRLRSVRAREARFLADASHELRTPVTALLADLEYTLSHPRSPDEHHEALRRALRTATHMRDLAANMLALTRSQSSDVTPISKRPLDLLELAEDVVDRLMPLAVNKDLELIVTGDQSDLAGDATLLSRLIENLAGNAIKYTDSGGVTLEVQPEGGNVWLRVVDTGPGIPPEVLERLTEPYSRGEESHRDSFGLGLAVVQSIVAAHGGHIEADSRVGLGTRILVRLPSGLPEGTAG